MRARTRHINSAIIITNDIKPDILNDVGSGVKMRIKKLFQSCGLVII